MSAVKHMEHACRLVPRILYPRWNSPKGLKQVGDFCKAIGSEELMLFPTGQLITPGWLSDEEMINRAEEIRKARLELEERGLTVTLNDCCFSDDFGHSTGLRNDGNWDWAVDITGKPAIGYRCFLSPKTRQAAIRRLLLWAGTGIKRILEDDEVRHDWHPSHTRNEGAHFCFCPLHLKAFSAFAGRRITREMLAEALQAGKPSDEMLRRKWMEFKRRVLIDFITGCEREVHVVYPTLRLGQMTTFPHFASLGGISFAEQVSAWAGPLKPVCRPAQGWYSDQDRRGLALGLALTLWTIKCLPEDTTIYSEVDWGCPWNQFKNSAQVNGVFQVKANLMLNINTHSLLQLGEGPDEPLIRRRLTRKISASRRLFDSLAANLPPDAKRAGLQFIMSESLAAAHPLKCRGPEGDAVDPWGMTGAGLGQPPWSQAFSTLARSGVALTFEDQPVAVLTGGIARALGPDLKRILETKNLVIDAGAAADLERMGHLHRFGLKTVRLSHSPINEVLTRNSINGSYGGSTVIISHTVSSQNIAAYATVKGGGRKHRFLATFIDAGHRCCGNGMALVSGLPGGRRACVLSYSLTKENAWGFGVRKQQWRGMLDFLAGRASWPVWIDEAHEVWPLLYRQPGSSSVWVAMINFGHDPIEDVVCHIAGSGNKTVHFIDDYGVRRKVPQTSLRRSGTELAVRLIGAHAVAPQDVRLLIVT